MNKRFIALAILPLILAPVAACSSGGSGGSSSACTTWVASSDDAVVASETNPVGCDGGNLLTQSAGTLTHVSGTPAHGSLACNIGNGWNVYVGPNGDPNGEAQGVCGQLQSVFQGGS